MTWDCFDSVLIKNTNVADGVATIRCLEPLFISVVNAVIAFTAVAFFIMTLLSGFTFLFSGGDQKKLEQARHTMTNSIVGLVVIVSAYLILRTITILTGVDVTKFNILIQ